MRQKVKGKSSNKYAKIPIIALNTPAWRSLGLAAQALLPWLVMEYKGKTFNNNGEISLSIRQAAEKMGIARDTAAKAFRDLQAKGFIVVKRGGSLGVKGHGKCPQYEITLIEMPSAAATHQYKKWSEGNDFAIFKHAVSNPIGTNKSPS